MHSTLPINNPSGNKRGKFAKEIVSGAVTGMISSLKGVAKGKDIQIMIKK